MKWFEIIEGKESGSPTPGEKISNGPADKGATNGAVVVESKVAREAREAKGQRLFVFQIIFGYTRQLFALLL